MKQEAVGWLQVTSQRGRPLGGARCLGRWLDSSGHYSVNALVWMTYCCGALAIYSFIHHFFHKHLLQVTVLVIYPGDIKINRTLSSIWMGGSKCKYKTFNYDTIISSCNIFNKHTRVLHIIENGGPLVRTSSQNLKCFYLGYVLLRLPKIPPYLILLNLSLFYSFMLPFRFLLKHLSLRSWYTDISKEQAPTVRCHIIIWFNYCSLQLVFLNCVWCVKNS